MKFSIVTCTWNSAATLADTIRSVQSQTHEDVEQIFVDGGSTDGTLEMIERMSPGSTVLRGVGGGISRAMNAGVRAATGDVIAHLHSDDFYAAPDVLASVESILRESRAKWVCGSMDVLRDGVRAPSPRRVRRFTPGRFARGTVSVLHPTVFLRREVFDEVGLFDESLRYAMDIDLWLRIMPRYLPVEAHRTLAVFRAHAGSLSTANAQATKQEEWAVRQRYWKRWPASTLYCWLRLRRMARRAAAAQPAMQSRGSQA